MSVARVTGVVFDLDGVIVDTEHLWEAAWTRYSASLGHTWTPVDTATVQGMSAPEWSAHIAALLGAPDRAGEVAEACAGAMVDAVRSGHGPLLPGARDLVAQASARVPVALASSAPRRVIDAVLAHHGLTGLFTATVSSEEVPRGKPNPDVYLAAARRIGVGNGSGAAVEDSSNGIRAAAAAGLHVIAIPNPTYPPRSDAMALADHVAADAAAALAYLLPRLPGPAHPTPGPSRAPSEGHR